MKLAIPAALICSSFSLKPLWILKWLSFNVGDVDKLPQEAGKFSEGSFKILASPPLLEDFFPPSGISRSGLFLTALKIH